MKGYYFITAAELSLAGNQSDVRSAVKAGVTAIQYRRKSGSTSAMIKEALTLRKLCGSTLFLINDRVDIALAAEADGVQAAGADYLGVSPVFSTRTKRDAGNPAGIELIRKIKKEVTIPIVAIGGIDLELGCDRRDELGSDRRAQAGTSCPGPDFQEHLLPIH